MADLCRGGMQDTGNPVLDSLVNLVQGAPGIANNLEKTYTLLLELAKKEPGGLNRRGKDGTLRSTEA